MLTDATGDSLDQQPSHDIRSVHIAEPFSADGSNKLVFTIKMSDMSGPLTPNTQWRVYFTGSDANGYFVDMRTTCRTGLQAGRTSQCRQQQRDFYHRGDG